MDLSTITVADFKAYFWRDFPFAASDSDPAICANKAAYIFNFDIEKAFLEAQALLNQSLFSDDATIRMAYYYLTAHFLVIDLKNASAGVDSVGSNPVSSRSVGSVSESYQIPDSYKENPQVAFLSSTGYGMKFLSIVLPALVGNVGAVAGWTQP